MTKKPKRDNKREHRIDMEIVVDCYDRHERAMGWYYYMESSLQFPFTAVCIAERAVSPLRIKDKVEVVGMAPEVECECEIFVCIRWDRPQGLAVPVAQLKPVRQSSEQTKQAVADWHYWKNMGYEY
jgi:hypothetical protein